MQVNKYNTDFDIEESINNNFIRLLKMRKEDETIKIPDDFEHHISSQEYIDFVRSILDYCQELFRLEQKQESLEAEAKQRGLPVPQILPSEKRKLLEKAKKMGLKYSVILFQRKAAAAQPGLSLTKYMDLKTKAVGNGAEDQLFYETLITFTSNVLEPAFQKENIPKLQEELTRLFRTNAFNITRRTQLEETRLKKYPQLKPPAKKETADEIIRRYAMRARVPNEKYRQSYIRQKTEIRPMFYNMTPHGARAARSPLVSLIFPSMKNKFDQYCKSSYNINRSKVKSFEKSGINNFKTKGANSKKINNNSMLVKPSELDQIIQEESKKKKKGLNQSMVNDYL